MAQPKKIKIGKFELTRNEWRSVAFRSFNRLPVAGRRIPYGRIGHKDLKPQQARDILAAMEQIARRAGFRSLDHLLKQPAAEARAAKAAAKNHRFDLDFYWWCVDLRRREVAELREKAGMPDVVRVVRARGKRRMVGLVAA